MLTKIYEMKKFYIFTVEHYSLTYLNKKCTNIERNFVLLWFPFFVHFNVHDRKISDRCGEEDEKPLKLICNEKVFEYRT